MGLAPAEAFDAYLVTGGLPLILDEWPQGATVAEYLTDALADPTSALLVSGERSVAAEFPTDAQARSVLGVIGSGERTFSLIGRAAGGLPHGSLSRALALLKDKRLIEAATPLSTRPSRETRYSVADPYLRFWLTFLEPHMSDVERGRGDLIAGRVAASWPSWRGRAIEPVVREALRRMRPGVLPDGTKVVEGYWTRSNDPEIDLVGADRAPVAQKMTFAGSVKWLERAEFDVHDLVRLVRHRAQLPGADDTTPLVAVTRTGLATDGVTSIGPDQLVEAWT